MRTKHRLELSYVKSGISPATPKRLAPLLQRLPPILHMTQNNTAQGYSKGPRGLFVLPRVIGIFADITISPGLWLRQCPTRCAFHAGRNLPDKEFRYLRTVIVTAAVYWGFGSELAHLTLTFQHRAGIRPYTSSFEFAESCVFSKQSVGPLHCGLSKTGTPSPEVTGLICRVP